MTLKLTKKFLEDSFLLNDEELFGKHKNKINRKISFPVFQNENITQELREYLQHCILESELSPDRIQRIVSHIRKIEKLIDSEKYQNLPSLSSVERKVFQSDIDDFFEKNKTLKKHSGDILNWYSWIRQEKVKNGKLDLFEEDFWYYDTLPFPIKNSHNIAKKIRFDTYCVPWVKDAVKKVVYHKLQIYCEATCRNFVDYCRTFDAFVKSHEINSPEAFTRDIIETDLIPFARKRYQSPKRYNGFLGSIKSLFSTASVLKVPKFSQKILFLKSDNLSRKRPDPKPYSDREKILLQEVCNQLEPLDADIMNLQALHGFRIMDICKSQITLPSGKPAMKKKDTGWIFTYYQFKRGRWTEMPLLSLAAEILLNRIKISEEKYGKNCLYIFATGETKFRSPQTHRRHIQKIVEKNGYKGDDGFPLRATKTHTLRQTFATDVIGAVHDPGVVSALLGQKDTSSLLHYIKINETEISNEMKALHEENDLLVKSMGKDCPSILPNSNIPSESNSGIALSNGMCCKSGAEICEHADSCLFCPMFKTDTRYLPAYKLQLSQTRISLQVAKIQGFDTIVEHEEKVIMKLEEIINVLEG